MYVRTYCHIYDVSVQKGITITQQTRNNNHMDRPAGTKQENWVPTEKGRILPDWAAYIVDTFVIILWVQFDVGFCWASVCLQNDEGMQIISTHIIYL